MTSPAVRMTGVVKTYPGVRALDEVDFEVRAGEVMGLVGENGAGKSTLLKILAGAVLPDAGTTELSGEPIRITDPRVSKANGIAVIHQELTLAPDLSVAENILVAAEPTRLGFLDKAEMTRRSTAALAELGVAVDPWAEVSTLSLARQQLVEIARALAAKARIVVMDEPTSALTEDEVDLLLDVVRRLRDSGVSVIYVSHRMREIFAVCDRVTVLRDGRHNGVLAVAETDSDALVTRMVGREITRLYGERSDAARDEVVLEVRGLRSGTRVHDVSFRVRAGEIVALAGLVGSGRTETAKAVFGAARFEGEIRLRGASVTFRHPRQAVRAGLGYLSEDRALSGLFLDKSVGNNISVTVPEQVAPGGWFRAARERRLGERFRTDLRIACPDVGSITGALSGGNQQKVALAKWLAVNPTVLLLDEPTRGVDIGAKAEIYRIIRGLAAEGVAIVLISSELTEVLGMSDRIVVLHEGRSVGELDAASATEETVVALATGVTTASAG
ncbi:MULTISPECIES: sugar ABC transporter ATP-binding protein [Actinoalloteichus]|uniref:ABC-type sugar transport system, ATPase component n=1 Tax=Actinoalloteichus fjordicus TaxID=1612552 RepID=A0AAC9PPW1_9PSEU|nr:MULTISPECIES: sugar ABC transporter ATP-binding protein [Actinoalloteichus]APU12292.1 ABC-type sugar transport system, ATPase component [Actinoalloteichus fjordicus]APU18244.1 ABC-type sugar transport system, ATPase component [Actinoalloteichus sp. GBA129-24]